MNSKSALSLIEEIIMVLVFAIATAVCLRIFVYSSDLSEKNDVLSHAVIEAGNAAEILKSSDGDIEKALELSDGDIRIEPVDSGSEYLGKAKITVLNEGEEVYSLSVSWQEGVS